MTQYNIYNDEAIAIMRKFVDQTIKDYTDPILKFSKFEKEREWYETAKDLVEGMTAIQWGDKYLTFEDILTIIGVSDDWFIDEVKKLSKTKTSQYYNKVLNKDKKKITIYLTGDKIPQPWMKNNFLPILDRYQNVINVTGPRPRCEEILRQSKMKGPEEYKKTIRRYLDYNMGIINNADIMLIRWVRHSKIKVFLHEIAHAYSICIPIYIITTSFEKQIPELLLAYSSKIYVSPEVFIKDVIAKDNKLKLLGENS